MPFDPSTAKVFNPSAARVVGFDPTTASPFNPFTAKKVETLPEEPSFIDKAGRFVGDLFSKSLAINPRLGVSREIAPQTAQLGQEAVERGVKVAVGAGQEFGAAMDRGASAAAAPFISGVEKEVSGIREAQKGEGLRAASDIAGGVLEHGIAAIPAVTALNFISGAVAPYVSDIGKHIGRTIGGETGERYGELVATKAFQLAALAKLGGLKGAVPLLTGSTASEISNFVSNEVMKSPEARAGLRYGVTGTFGDIPEEDRRRIVDDLTSGMFFVGMGAGAKGQRALDKTATAKVQALKDRLQSKELADKFAKHFEKNVRESGTQEPIPILKTFEPIPEKGIIQSKHTPEGDLELRKVEIIRDLQRRNPNLTDSEVQILAQKMVSGTPKPLITPQASQVRETVSTPRQTVEQTGKVVEQTAPKPTNGELPVIDIKSQEKAIIEDQGLRYDRQGGSGLVNFTDPQTGSTLAMKSGEITPESLAKHVEESRAKFAEGEKWKKEQAGKKSEYPKAGKVVDGRTVRSDVPNTSSISASLTNYEELPGIREVPMSDFNLTGKTYSADDNARIKQLASQIGDSKEINPLIVVVDKDGSYILEGAKRADALYNLGAKSFPAVVVKDLDNPPIAKKSESSPEPTREELRARYNARKQSVSSPPVSEGKGETPENIAPEGGKKAGIGKKIEDVAESNNIAAWQLRGVVKEMVDATNESGSAAISMFRTRGIGRVAEIAARDVLGVDVDAIKTRLGLSGKKSGITKAEDDLFDKAIADEIKSKNPDLIAPEKSLSPLPKSSEIKGEGEKKTFSSVEDANSWIKQKSKEHGSRGAFLASDEYKNAYPEVKRVFDEKKQRDKEAAVKGREVKVKRETDGSFSLNFVQNPDQYVASSNGLYGGKATFKTEAEAVAAAQRGKLTLVEQSTAQRSGKKLPTPQQLSDFRVGTDIVKRIGDKTFVVDAQGSYKKVEVQPDKMTSEFEANIRKIPTEKLAQYRNETAQSPYLSDEGKAERLKVFDEEIAKRSSPPSPVEGGRDYAKTWDDQSKLGRRIHLVMDARWITNNGKMSKLGERIVHSNWNDLSEDAQDVLKRGIDKFYQQGREASPALSQKPLQGERTPEKQPWEMTTAQWQVNAQKLQQRESALLSDYAKKHGDQSLDPNTPTGRAANSEVAKILSKEIGRPFLQGELAGTGQAMSVYNAMKEGKDVPPEVVREWLDNVKKMVDMNKGVRDFIRDYPGLKAKYSPAPKVPEGKGTPEAIDRGGEKFLGNYEAGETLLNGKGKVLGNFNRKMDATALGHQEGGSVISYLNGKYKSGWLVVRSVSESVEKHTIEDPSPLTQGKLAEAAKAAKEQGMPVKEMKATLLGELEKAKQYEKFADELSDIERDYYQKHSNFGKSQVAFDATKAGEELLTKYKDKLNEAINVLKESGIDAQTYGDDKFQRLRIITKIPGDGEFFTALGNLDEYIGRVQRMFPTTDISYSEKGSFSKPSDKSAKGYTGKGTPVEGTGFYATGGSSLIRGEMPKGMKLDETWDAHEPAKKMIEEVRGMEKTPVEKLGYAYNNVDFEHRAVSKNPVVDENSVAIFKTPDGNYISTSQKLINSAEKAHPDAKPFIDEKSRLVLQTGKTIDAIIATDFADPKARTTRQATREQIEKKYGDLSFILGKKESAAGSSESSKLSPAYLLKDGTIIPTKGTHGGVPEGTDLEKIADPETKSGFVKNGKFLTNKEAAEAGVTQVQSGKQIEDFGEKIGGARKDQWRTKAMTVDDLSKLTEREAYDYTNKDNVWNKPDYQKYVDNGLSKAGAYVIKGIHDALPLRPELSKDEAVNVQRRKDYIDIVTRINKAVDSIKSDAELSQLFDRVFTPDLYDKSAERGKRWTEEGTRLARIIDSKVTKKLQVGTWELVDAKHKAEKNSFLEDAEGWEKVAKKKGVEVVENKQSEVAKGNIIGKYFVARSSMILGEGFETREQANQFIKDYLTERGYMKGGGGTKNVEPVRPGLEFVTRTGKDYRGGKDVTEKQLQDEFGFRGGEFGNWETQKDRQAKLNFAYDALRDLADAVGVPPKAISLNGELGIAFGARGTGGKHAAAAHYEPTKVVINLTKISGAGTFAHEWAHALDDYFGRQSKTQSAKEPYVSHGFDPSKTQMRKEIADSWNNINNTIKKRVAEQQELVDETKSRLEKSLHNIKEWLGTIRRGLEQEQSVYGKETPRRKATPEELARFDGLTESITKGIGGKEELQKIYDLYENVKNTKTPIDDRKGVEGNLDYKEGLDRRLERILNGEITDTKDTHYLAQAKKIDQNRSKPYWSTPHEMFARAFEGFIYDRIKEAGGRSDYLVSGVENAAYEITKQKPYAEGTERGAINRAIGEFLSKLKTEKTDKGVKLFGLGLGATAQLAIDQSNLPDDEKKRLKAIALGLTIAGFAGIAMSKRMQEASAEIRSGVLAKVISGKIPQEQFQPELTKAVDGFLRSGDSKDFSLADKLAMRQANASPEFRQEIPRVVNEISVSKANAVDEKTPIAPTKLQNDEYMRGLVFELEQEKVKRFPTERQPTVIGLMKDKVLLYNLEAKGRELEGSDAVEYVRGKLLNELNDSPEYQKYSTSGKLYAARRLESENVDRWVKDLDKQKRKDEIAREVEARDLRISNQVSDRILNSKLPPATVQTLLKIASRYRVNKDNQKMFTAEFKSRISVMANSYGAAGGELAAKMYDGDIQRGQLMEHGNHYLNKVRDIYDEVKNPFEQEKISNQVIDALENRATAESKLTSPEAKEAYKHSVEMLDYFKGLLKQKGYGVREDYFTHIKDVDILDQVLNGIEDSKRNPVQNLNEFITEKSRFLKPRTDADIEIKRDLPIVLSTYLRSVTKELAYREGVDYYYTRFSKDIPTALKINSTKRAIEFMKNALDPERGRGAFYNTVNFIRSQQYRNFLGMNLKASAQNMTQVEFARLRWMDGVDALRKKLWREKANLTGALADAVDIASAETPRFLELVKADEDTRQSTLSRLFNRIDTFQKSEGRNWGQTELGSILNHAMKEKDFPKLKTELGEMGAVNKLLEDKNIFDGAVREAAVTSAETQVASAPSMRGEFYDAPLHRIIGMFTAFKTRQLQVLGEALKKQEGINGTRTQLILRRGLSNDIEPVEVLREVEGNRAAIENMLKKADKFKQDIGIPRDRAQAFVDYLKTQEKDLNDIIAKAEPIRGSKTKAAINITRYTAKIAAISVAFSLLWDSVDVAVYGDEDKDKNMIARAAKKAFWDILPAPFYGSNPSKFLVSPVAPNLEHASNYGNFSGRGLAKDITSYGFNAIPFGGLIDRATGKRISGGLVDFIVPKKESSPASTVQGRIHQLKKEQGIVNPKDEVKRILKKMREEAMAE